MKMNRSHDTRRQSGFSLLEMMIVLALTMIATSITFMTLEPALKQQRVTNSYNIVLSALRQARDNAVAQRTSYSVSFNAGATPNTLTVAPTFAGFQGALNPVTYSLPTGVKFDNEPGIPNTNLTTPDRFGVGANPVDFGYTGQGVGLGGSALIYFCPDGSAQDSPGCSGNVNNGVVYIARPGELLSSRAISVWGATGRIRGWRLYTGGGPNWQRQ
jgi:prepilin-type N-terminal cleavage/methylation domain-containing protein